MVTSSVSPLTTALVLLVIEYSLLALISNMVLVVGRAPAKMFTKTMIANTTTETSTE